jgi:hypothetical protein
MTITRLPSASQLRTISEHVKVAINVGSPDVVKQWLGELIDRVEIGPDKRAQPYFRVPNEQRPGPSLARACETPVRMGSRRVRSSRK